MKIKIGYKEWDTRDWIVTADSNQKFLQCPDCHCGIFLDWYDRACGTDALNFCPYCGRERKKVVKNS